MTDTMGSLTLVTLPPELLERICFFLDNKHFKELRVVSKLWSNICAPYLFKEIWVHASRRSFEDLECLAESQLRHHVEEILYDGRDAYFPTEMRRRIEGLIEASPHNSRSQQLQRAKQF